MSHEIGAGRDRELCRRSPVPSSSTAVTTSGTAAPSHDDKPTTKWSQRTSNIDSHASTATIATDSTGEKSAKASPRTRSKTTPPFESLMASRPKRKIIPKNLVHLL